MSFVKSCAPAVYDKKKDIMLSTMLRPLWLLVGTPSAFGPELAYRLRESQPTLMDVTRYFWYTLILLYMFVYYIFMTSPLWLAVGPQSI